MNRSFNKTSGFALATVMIFCAVLLLTAMVYTTLTLNNVKTSRNDGNYSAGMYAAEAALNGRVERIKARFQGFLTPTGDSPSALNPCTNSNLGSGDFACLDTTVNSRNTISYVIKGTESQVTIPAGQDFAGLSASETPYTVYGRALNANGNPEAIATLAFRSRLVPLFQFAIFYDKDLEFENTAQLTLSGPVHTNGNLFLDAGRGSTLTMTGQVTSARSIYRGKKTVANCSGGAVVINNDSNSPVSSASCSARFQMTASDLTPYGNRLKDNIGVLTVPTVGILQPRPGGTYWEKADIRVVLKNTGTYASPVWTPQVVRASGEVVSIAGTDCTNGLATSQNLRDNREAQVWDSSTTPNRSLRRTLDVNVPLLLSCMQLNRNLLGLSGLDDTTDGGLVIYMTVDDMAGTTISSGLLRSVLGSAGQNTSQSDPPVPNNYAVRLFNGARLASSNSGDPAPKGITFVTDQAAFIEGSFNSAANAAGGWIPAAVMSDSINILSSNWRNTASLGCTRIDTNTFIGTTYNSRYAPTTVAIAGVNHYLYGGVNAGLVNTRTVAATSANPDIRSTFPLACRNASDTTVNAAILAGTSRAGDENVTYNNSTMAISGGVHNMPRFHENWNYGTTPFRFRGSLVSLNTPLHASGAFKLDDERYYTPPNRIWSFDTAFQTAANLPPLSPRFIYVHQDNMTRDFQQ